MKKFSKAKMIERIKQEGKSDAIPPEIEWIMNNLDGQFITEDLDLRVSGKRVLWCVGKDGCGAIVYESDCVVVS